MTRRPDEDPVLRSARREALVIGGFALCALIYTVSYCCVNGYGRGAEDLRFIWGFPDWIFKGIVIPWGLCTLFSAWFTFGFMKDDPLGEDAGGESGPETAAPPEVEGGGARAPEEKTGG